MQTHFTPAQLADPDLAVAEDILRTCVHCGFCTATCPTYVLLGDELDGPRGRIMLIKDMLENERPATESVTRHVDRCLSCLSCMTTCPSGVDYMHLVDIARVRIERTYRRPLIESWLRALLARVLPRPGLFRLALQAAKLARPFRRLLPGRLAGMTALAPRRLPPPSPGDRPRMVAAVGHRRLRVALLTGCAQQVLRPRINEATVRLLTRLGCDVVIAAGSGCCGALVHHLGREEDALTQIRANVAAWEATLAGGGLDAVVANASGCGTMVKDYGFLLRKDEALAESGRRIASMALDVSEVVERLGLGASVRGEGRVVAYHAACSLGHGQRVREPPKRLLAAAGFEVREPAEAHLCCGSAGTYNLLQDALSARLRARKQGHLEALGAELVATGNIGCLVQIAHGGHLPVAHTVELLDWATGGPPPPELAAAWPGAITSA